MKSVQVVRAKLAKIENPDSIAIDIAAGWDHRRAESIVQAMELSQRRASEGIGATRSDETPVCREVDFARLPRDVCGVKGAMYRPFLVSIMGIACICVCVCLLLRGPQNVLPLFTWSGLEQGKE